MVNYQGPTVLRPLVETLDVPIFNRVTKIRYVTSGVKELKISPEDVAQMRDLREISVRRRRQPSIDEADKKAIVKSVPDCRLKSVETTKDTIDVKIFQGSPFQCSSP